MRILADLRGAMYYLGDHTEPCSSHQKQRSQEGDTPNAPLPSRTGMYSGYSPCHTRLSARNNTGNLVLRRHVDTRRQGNRFRIYCKRAYNSIAYQFRTDSALLRPACIPGPIHPLSGPTSRDSSSERQSGRDWCCMASPSTIACRALLIIREVPTTKLHLIWFSR